MISLRCLAINERCIHYFTWESSEWTVSHQQIYITLPQINQNWYHNLTSGLRKCSPIRNEDMIVVKTETILMQNKSLYKSCIDILGYANAFPMGMSLCKIKTHLTGRNIPRLNIKNRIRFWQFANYFYYPIQKLERLTICAMTLPGVIKSQFDINIFRLLKYDIHFRLQYNL